VFITAGPFTKLCVGDCVAEKMKTIDFILDGKFHLHTPKKKGFRTAKVKPQKVKCDPHLARACKKLREGGRGGWLRVGALVNYRAADRLCCVLCRGTENPPMLRGSLIAN
jgi:hypothetical protein